MENITGKKNIAVIQPVVPHYRSDFFEYLRQSDITGAFDIYVYEKAEDSKKSGFNIGSDRIKYLPNKIMGGAMFYRTSLLLSSQYDTLILMLQFSHLTTWWLLLTKCFHKKKIILWGQGISVKRYLQEEKAPDKKLEGMIAMADGVWLYTEKELEMWRRIFPDKKMVALQNTLSGAKEITEFVPKKSKAVLKEEYGITQKTILIFCARFESNYRRVDLLEEAIGRLDADRFGFIIIGAGRNKPDFTQYRNVYDFGAVYDTAKKRDLFTIADIYFQPGWVGLSIVEAMAYGKPVCTFKRTAETKQCVEYSYIIPHVNGLIFEDMDDCVSQIESLSDVTIAEMGTQARIFVSENLTEQQMADRALSLISKL